MTNIAILDKKEGKKLLTHGRHTEYCHSSGKKYTNKQKQTKNKLNNWKF